MLKLTFLIFFISILLKTEAQPIEVRADYNSVGDVDFVAYNNTKAPLFLNINFDDLENTTFDESLPYVKKLESGFNALFTLLRDADAGDYPRFHYDINLFRSNPAALVNLNFPYLIPFEPGTKIQSFTVDNIHGFFGLSELNSWNATGFKVQNGRKVFTARTGTIVEINGAQPDENALLHYCNWNYSITLLQPDGTLACYKNVVDKTKKLKVGQRIYAGNVLGEIVQGTNKLVFLVYHESLLSAELVFIIPEFVVSKNENKLILSDHEYVVVHPEDVYNSELTRKEIKVRNR